MAIRVVTSFAELLATPMVGACNAVCWQRSLDGDFDEVVRAVFAGEAITPLQDAQLLALPLRDTGRIAVATLVADQQRLRAIGHNPVLEVVSQYERDDPRELVATDVYSFHVDRATVATDTFLCSYTAPASEGLPNDQAIRRVDDAQVRSKLLAQFGGHEGPEFEAWLADHCFDLHYAPLPNAQPFPFGVGNFWRIAVDYPNAPVPACIHRAPCTNSPRLLLIS